MRTIRAAATYSASAFAVGFALGTARVFFVAPKLGPLPATLLELPLMLAASWWICGWTMRRFAVPPDPAVRLRIGALAFLLLIAAEALLGIVAFDRTWTEQSRAFVSPEGLAGLAAQIVFALLPVLRRTHSADLQAR